MDSATVTRVTPRYGVTPVTQPVTLPQPETPKQAPSQSIQPDAESIAFERDPANDPERIIAAWTGHDLTGSDVYRLNNALAALSDDPPVKAGPRTVSRVELFVRALKAKRDAGHPYGSLSGTLIWCNKVIARCAADGCMPDQWEPLGSPKKAKDNRTRQIEADTDWGNRDELKLRIVK